MAYSLDVVVLDDQPEVCEVLSDMLRGFYTWGEIRSFTDPYAAKEHCMAAGSSLAVFVVDVFLEEGLTAFDFLGSLGPKFPMAFQDSIIITGRASEEVVDLCMREEVAFLLEKPVEMYALRFAVRSIVSRYHKFARRIMRDPVFAQDVDGLIWDAPPVP
jgi:DNA-binding NtrC family response regulator